MQFIGNAKRRLTSQLNHHSEKIALLALQVNDVHHVFGGERFEIETVGGVVIGAHGFGVAVDHNAFHVRFFESEGRVDAAVVELDPLSDSIRSATQYDHLITIRNSGFFLGGPIA